jgi:hypothetical protein
VKRLFCIQCQSSFQFRDRIDGGGGRRWSGIEFACLLIAKSRFNCSKTHSALQLDASVVCARCDVYSVRSENVLLLDFRVSSGCENAR